MLLEFTAKNYKTFRDKMVFSLMPAPKQKGLDYSLLHETAGKKKYVGLPTSVVYGANAAGKTNLIGAMDTFKQIVLRGNIRNAEIKNPNTAAGVLQLAASRFCKAGEPVEFSIKFITNSRLIEYAFSMDVGNLKSAPDYSRRVIKESLLVNDVQVFSRVGTKNLTFGDFKKMRDLSIGNFENEQSIDSAIDLAKKNMLDDELFLTNGFKNIFSAKLASDISEWLTEKFIVIYHSDMLQTTRKFTNLQSKVMYPDDFLMSVAQALGIKTNKLVYAKDDDSTQPELYSAVDHALIPAGAFESYGTIRFLNIAPLIFKALSDGETLVIDEFDASIHPMVISNLITIFHNDEINRNNAQLIFNTHNPIFLNHRLFRRDEIKFVDRSEDEKSSEVYSLADFGTAGEGSVRKDADYMANYLDDRYGGIKDFDMGPLLKSMLYGEE